MSPDPPHLVWILRAYFFFLFLIACYLYFVRFHVAMSRFITHSDEDDADFDNFDDEEE